MYGDDFRVGPIKCTHFRVGPNMYGADFRVGPRYFCTLGSSCGADFRVVPR